MLPPKYISCQRKKYLFINCMNRTQKIFLLISVYTFLTALFSGIFNLPFFAQAVQIITLFFTGLVGIKLFKDKKEDN